MLATPLALPPHGLTTVVPATWELTRGQLKTSVSEYPRTAVPKLVEWVYKDYDQKRVT